MSESKHKIFVNRNWLSISIAVIIVAFLLAYLIMYFTKVALYVQIIVYCLILLLGIALIIHFLKFIIFAPGYIEIIDYRYLRKKSIVIKIEDIDKVHLDYIYNRSALIYYGKDTGPTGFVTESIGGFVSGMAFNSPMLINIGIMAASSIAEWLASFVDGLLE